MSHSLCRYIRVCDGNGFRTGTAKMCDALEVELTADARVRSATAQHIVVGEWQHVRVDIIVTGGI